MQRSAMGGNLRFSANNRDTLEKWLKSRCRWSDNVFDDPGYSEYYKSYFTWLFNDGTYVEEDIDNSLNIGHYEPIFEEGITPDEFNEKLEPYIDFVPSGMSNSIVFSTLLPASVMAKSSSFLTTPSMA